MEVWVISYEQRKTILLYGFLVSVECSKKDVFVCFPFLEDFDALPGSLVSSEVEMPEPQRSQNCAYEFLSSHFHLN